MPNDPFLSHRSQAVDSAGDGACARSRSRRALRHHRAAVCAADQSVLSQGPARQLRQARADADAGADQHRRHHAGGLGRRVLGRKPAPRPAAVPAVPAGRRHHRPPDLRQARLRAGATGIARAERRWSSAGCTCCRVPTSARRMRTPWRSAKACSSGRGSCATSRPERLQPRLRGHLRERLSRRSAAAASILPRRSFLTTTSLIATRGCHNRCGFCYLATDGLHMPYRMRDAQQVVDEFQADDQPYAVFIDNNLGSRRDYLRAACAGAAAAEENLERGRHHRRDRRSVADPRDGAGRLHGRVRRLRVADRRQPRDASKKTPKTADYARRVRMLHDHGIQVNGSFRPRLRPRPQGRLRADGRLDRRESAGMRHVSHPDALSGTPLFRQMEAEGRLLHRDWTLYDTGHVVFRPKHMTPEELEQATRGATIACSRMARSGGADHNSGGRPAVSGDVVSLQALEPLLASADQA